MKIKAIYATADEIPEAFKESYTEVEGKGFVLQVEEVNGHALEDVNGLRTALGEQNKQNKTITGFLKNYGAYDKETGKFEAKITGEGVEALETKIADLQQQLEAAGPGDSKKKIEQLQEGFKAKLAEVQAAHETQLTEVKTAHKTEHDKLLGQYETVAKTNTIDAAILKHNGKDQYLRPHINAMARLDDERKLVLYDGDRPRMGADGQPQSVDSYVEEMKKDVDRWGDAFNAAPAAGPGTKGGRPTPLQNTKPAEPSEGAYFVEQGTV